MEPRRLCRSRRDRQLAGVAGGIAAYLEIDPTVVRVLWILSIFLGGFSILLYIILVFVMPLEPVASPAPGWAPSTGPTWGAPSQPTPTGEARSGAAVPGWKGPDAGAAAAAAAGAAVTSDAGSPPAGAAPEAGGETTASDAAATAQGPGSNRRSEEAQ